MNIQNLERMEVSILRNHCLMTLLEVRPSNTSCNAIDNWMKKDLRSTQCWTRAHVYALTQSRAPPCSARQSMFLIKEMIYSLNSCKNGYFWRCSKYSEFWRALGRARTHNVSKIEMSIRCRVDLYFESL